jgi:hypothetical protein
MERTGKTAAPASVGSRRKKPDALPFALNDEAIAPVFISWIQSGQDEPVLPGRSHEARLLPAMCSTGVRLKRSFSYETGR